MEINDEYFIINCKYSVINCKHFAAKLVINKPCHNYVFINFIYDDSTTITIVGAIKLSVKLAIDVTIKFINLVIVVTIILVIVVFRSISKFNFIIWVVIQ